jgi:hypothetical protein
MAHLLLIDDDPALIPKLVRQVFPGPAHRVEVAGTGAEASSGSVPCRRTSFSSTCACPTSPAWGSAGRSVARFGVVARGSFGMADRSRLEIKPGRQDGY